MGMRDKPIRRSHEVPGMSSEIQTELQFGDSPISLNRSARISLDGQSVVLATNDRSVFEHTETIEELIEASVTSDTAFGNPQDISLQPKLESAIEIGRSISEMVRMLTIGSVALRFGCALKANSGMNLRFRDRNLALFLIS